MISLSQIRPSLQGLETSASWDILSSSAFSLVLSTCTGFALLSFDQITGAEMLLYIVFYVPPPRKKNKKNLICFNC